MTITTAMKLSCINRELHMRSKVYLKRVEAGSMKQQEADYEIAVMEAIKADYEAQREGQLQAQQSLFG